MRKVLLSLVGSGLVAGTAGAALYTDINSYGLTQINKSSPFYGEFDITGGVSGYKPSSDQLSDASATFVLTDTNLNTESVTISLANSPVGTVGSSFGAMVSSVYPSRTSSATASCRSLSMQLLLPTSKAQHSQLRAVHRFRIEEVH